MPDTDWPGTDWPATYRPVTYRPAAGRFGTGRIAGIAADLRGVVAGLVHRPATADTACAGAAATDDVPRPWPPDPPHRPVFSRYY